MSNVPVITARKLIKVLKKSGYIFDHSVGSHHVYIQSSTHKRVSVPVHPGKDLGKGITRSILKDAQISLDEFLKLV